MLVSFLNKSTQRAIRYNKRRYLFAKRLLARLFFGLPTVRLHAITGADNDMPYDPILDKICLPPYFGPDTHDDLTAVMNIARALQPRIVCELGTAYGNLTANILKQCPSAKVFTVNAPAEEQTGTFVTFSISRAEIGHVYRDYGYASRVCQIFRDTMHLKMSDYFSGPVIDLAIIDACHDTKYVINDFLKLLPAMHPEGLILFHDTHPSMKSHLAGSYEACMWLRRQGHDIRHIEGTWWGVYFNRSIRLPVSTETARNPVYVAAVR